MRATVTSDLLDQLNKAKGLKYPAVGYQYFADIKGDGTYQYRVWEVANPGGGVRYSSLNRPTARQRCAAIREAIAAAKA